MRLRAFILASAALAIAAPAFAENIDNVQFAQLKRRDQVPDITQVQPEPGTGGAEAPAGEAPTDRTLPAQQSGGTEQAGGDATPRRGAEPETNENAGQWQPAGRNPNEAERLLADPDTIVSRPLAEQILGDVPPTAAAGGGRRLASPERRLPGAGPFEPYPEPEINPGAVEAPPPRAAGPEDFLPIPDRWRLIDTLGIVDERWWDPYNQNTLKGDKPIYKGWCVPPLKFILGKAPSDCFVVLLGISDTVVEPRSFPTPTGVQSTRNAGTNDLFGGADQIILNQNFIHSVSLINGDTAFRPQDVELRFTGVMNINHAAVEEDRVLFADPAKGSSRTDFFYGVQEAFIDYHAANISDRYDFYSVRAGIQPFSSDFRGFLFQDNQLGFRFFGNWDNNLWQYNLAYFRRLEKDTNSGLNDVTQEWRNDDVFVANVYRQDFPVLGLQSQATLVYNRNREGGDFYFDDNGFLARPASIATQRGRDYDVFYAGVNMDGRIGRVNLTSSAYYAFGNDDNVFTGGSQNISAFFGAAEVSMDFDWKRFRLSALYASGDDDPHDNTGGGFDAIFENPQFAGGDTSYWIRQQIPLIGGGIVGLSMRNGVLPSLRHSKEHGQSNFINPGIILIGGGFDFDLTPEFRLSGNLNQMWFDDTSSLEALRQQPVAKNIGLDASLAAIWRPWQHQNVVLRLSGAALFPGQGFNDLYATQDGHDIHYSILGNIILTY